MFFQEILSNHILKTTLLAWAIAQILKVFIVLWTQKMGFYPSSRLGRNAKPHSALVTALATCVGKAFGLIQGNLLWL